MVEFQRARSEEQREQRRQAILSTAAAMLGEMPVADLGLNELSRRVGLAKSNVLRYFESREAVLLELLDQAGKNLLSELQPLLEDDSGDLRARSERLINAMVSTLSANPVLCDLIGAQASILERNISADAAAQFKRAALANVFALAAEVRQIVPELEPDQAVKFIGASQMCAGALWSHSNPAPAMLEAYERYPDLAALRLDFETTLTELLFVLLRGLICNDARLGH